MHLSKIPILETVDVDFKEPQFTKILPLSPYEQGTGDVEALSSYICRQAEDSMEMAHPFSKRCLEDNLDEDQLINDHKIPSQGLHCCNGFGVMSDRFIKSITDATEGSVDAEMLTMRPLRYLSRKRAQGVMRSHMAWCHECWQEDMALGQVPYVRLYWLFQHTKVCVKHSCGLMEYCPVCGEVKKQFPTFPRQWICDKCGRELFTKNSKYKSDVYSPKDEWISHTLYRLVDRVYRDNLDIQTTHVTLALRRLLRSYGLSAHEFAIKLNIEPKVVERLLKKGGRPYFPALLDMCYRLDIPLDHFLFDRDILTSPKLWRILPKPYFQSHSTLEPKKKAKIKRKLQRIIDSNPSPPIRVSHLASEIGIPYSSLHYHFPDEYETLRERYVTWERGENRVRHTNRLEKLCTGFFSLVKQGIYPSDRKLRDLGLVLPSDLRREDVKTLLRTLQEIYGYDCKIVKAKC